MYHAMVHIQKRGTYTDVIGYSKRHNSKQLDTTYSRIFLN